VTTIGIDNGSTGSIGILNVDGAVFESVPTVDYLHYGKRGSISQRLDRSSLTKLVEEHVAPMGSARVYIERPFTGKFVNAVIPAHRFFEATIIVLEDLRVGYEVVDSREWQAEVLGPIKGSALLKRASRLRGIQLYPRLENAIKSHGDADGLLIAHHYHHRRA
jgi:hypothetical protein